MVLIVLLRPLGLPRWQSQWSNVNVTIMGRRYDTYTIVMYYAIIHDVKVRGLRGNRLSVTMIMLKDSPLQRWIPIAVSVPIDSTWY